MEAIETSTPGDASAAIARVLVVGAGTMGGGIAQVVAESGIETLLFDAESKNLDHALRDIYSRWDRDLATGRADPPAVAAWKISLRAGDEADAAEADLIIEAIFEDLDAKSALWAKIAAIAKPSALFASNTSSISVTALGHASARPERFLGLHFFNPVPRLPLVEVVRGLDTNDESVASAVGFVKLIGKTPIIVNDAPGFVANRILLPMINEAVYTLQDGVADAESIDEVMKLGMSHPMGPLALADLIGLDICLAILETLHRDFGDDKYRPAPLLRRMVAAGKFGRKVSQGFYTY